MHNRKNDDTPPLIVRRTANRMAMGNVPFQLTDIPSMAVRSVGGLAFFGGTQAINAATEVIRETSEVPNAAVSNYLTAPNSNTTYLIQASEAFGGIMQEFVEQCDGNTTTVVTAQSFDAIHTTGGYPAEPWSILSRAAGQIPQLIFEACAENVQENKASNIRAEHQKEDSIAIGTVFGTIFGVGPVLVVIVLGTGLLIWLCYSKCCRPKPSATNSIEMEEMGDESDSEDTDEMHATVEVGEETADEVNTETADEEDLAIKMDIENDQSDKGKEMEMLQSSSPRLGR